MRGPVNQGAAGAKSGDTGRDASSWPPGAGNRRGAGRRWWAVPKPRLRGP